MNSTNCKNCEAPLLGNFCSNCGQTAHVHRVTIKHFLHEFFHAFTHTDKGIFLLIKELILRPGIVAREYLDGKRKKYFSPLTFLIIIASLYAYIGHLTGFFYALSASDRYKGRPQFVIEAMGIMDTSGKVVSVFLMPVLISLFTRMFFFRSRNNLAENLVLNSMVLGQIYLLAIVIFIPWYLLSPQTPIYVNNGVFHFLMWIYLVIAYYQFFRGNIFLTILKTILINVLFIIFFWVFIFGYVLLKHAIVG
jgi:hypothetical protein